MKKLDKLNLKASILSLEQWQYNKNIITYFDNQSTNASAESFHAKIKNL